MKTFKALVRVNNVLIEVHVLAQNYVAALRMLQGQYGAAAVVSPPTPID